MLRFAAVFFFLFFGCLVNAQKFLTLSDQHDKLNYKAISDSQISSLFTIYNQRIDVSNELINGRDYVPYYYRSESKPLLFNEKKHTGSLVLNGKKYDNLSLDYDTYLDELIYSDITKFFVDKQLMITLNKDLFDGFTLHIENDSLVFRHFKSGNGSKFNLPDGFYEVVYNGKSKYIIKHQSSVTREQSIEEYIYSTTDYVMVGEDYSRVRSKKGLVKLFAGKSREIKKFMRTSRIHNRKMDKKQISSVLKYYDTMIWPNQQP
jgi:hypothetical protein